MIIHELKVWRLLAPPMRNIAVEVLDPGLGQWEYSGDCADYVLVRVDRVVGKLNYPRTKGEISQGRVISAEIFRFRIFKVVFDRLIAKR